MSTKDPTDIPVEDPRPADLRRAQSLVLVNTGNGKGKTSAAIGVAIRGHARGWPVAVVQFLKSGTWRTGEEKVCRELGIDWWEHDPWLTGKSRELVDENRRLRERLAAVEERLAETRPVEGHVVEDEPIERRATRRAERRRD